MKIGFIGMTHLGLCQLAACAEKRFQVYGFDLDKEKIISLKNLKTYYDEPNLKRLLKKNSVGIKFSSNFKDIKKLELVFISLDIKTKKNGQSDTKDLLKLINKTKKFVNSKAVLVVLSQVKPDLQGL